MGVIDRLKDVKMSCWYEVDGDGTVYDLYIDNAFEGRVRKILARDEDPWARSFSADGSPHGFSDCLATAQALLLREIHDGAGRTSSVFGSLEEKRQRIQALEDRLRKIEPCAYPIGRTTCGYTVERHIRADGSPMDHPFTYCAEATTLLGSDTKDAS